MMIKHLYFYFYVFFQLFANGVFCQSKQDTLWVWIDAQDVIYLYSAYNDQIIYKVSVDSNYFEQTVLKLRVNNRSTVRFYAELAADARVVSMVAEDLKRLGYHSFEVEAIAPNDPYRSELAIIAQEAIFPPFIKRPISTSFTIVLLAHHQLAYYLAEEYPRIRIQKINEASIKQLFAGLKDTPVTIKIEPNANPEDAKALIRAFDEFEVFNYQFGEIHEEERNIIKQLLH